MNWRRSFSPVSQALPGWPGSWDAAFALRTILLVTALMGAFCISMDLQPIQFGAARLFFHACPSGGLLLVFGFVERATAAEGIFWERGSEAHFLPHISITPTPAHSST